MELRRYALAGYVIWMAVLTAAYYGIGGLRPAAWSLIGLSGVLAIVTGLFINRPARLAPWLLLAAALATFAAGQVSFLVMDRLGMTIPFPSFLDALYLATYPLYAAGLLIFIHWRTPDRDPRSLIDALALTTGLALLSWTFLIRPYVHYPGLSWPQKAVAITYPLGDVLVLALLARLLAPGTGRTRAVQLLTLGAVAGLASDVAFGVTQLNGRFHSGTGIDLGWAIFYAAWGAAALHPSMARLTEPVSRQPDEVSPGRLALLLLASLVAPAVLFTAPADGRTGDVGVIAVLTAILYLLVLARLWEVAASHGRALDRERVLRQSVPSLVTATDLDQVAVTVRNSVTALSGGRSGGDVVLAVLAVRDGSGLRVMTGTPDSPPTDALDRLAETWLALAAGTAPVLTPARLMPGETGAATRDADWVLLCPLTFDEDPAGGRPSGLIAVRGEQRALAGLSATLEILAYQVARTAESMTLRRAVTHQGHRAYFRALVRDASDAIMIVGDDGKIRYATPSTAGIFGDIATEGEYVWDLVAETDRERLARTLTELRERAPHSTHFTDQQIVRRDGRNVQIQIRCSDRRADPDVAGLVFTFRDVTEQRQLEDELTHRAFHDALTGLPNRVLFQDRISQQLAAARRTGLLAGVIFADLDDFKLVNDTMGHRVGDELLVATADRLSTLIRDSDTAARLGGDEFAMLITNAEDVTALESAAERVVRAFAEPFPLSTGPVSATITVGIATSLDAADTDELLSHADLALYAAKAAGKRQWRHYQPVLSAGIARRREVQEALTDAVARSALTLVYQPIIELASGELVGFEALVRWPHEQWGMMRPDQFISLAEETGQIIAIGSWVLGRATADIVKWRQGARPTGADVADAAPGAGARAEQPAAAGRRDLYVSVNVSPRQFADPGFADKVRQVLRSSGLEPRALMLELTETTLSDREGRLPSDLTELRDIGVRIAIDDFGTGYSSLSYLRELPIDVVKMDRSFVEGIAESDRRLALAEGIVRIARTLDLEVIAEGIETDVQRDLLTRMGCSYGQGYLLAMPMGPIEAEELARNGFPAAGLVPAWGR